MNDCPSFLTGGGFSPGSCGLYFFVFLLVQNLQFEQQLQESDLGARMSAAFKSILDRGMEKAIIIGTDVPDIESTTVEAAFDALNHNDVRAVAYSST